MLSYAPRFELEKPRVGIGMSVLTHLVILAILLLSTRVIIAPPEELAAGPNTSFALHEFAETAPAPLSADGIVDAADLQSPLVRIQGDQSLRSADQQAASQPPPRPDLQRELGLSTTGGVVAGKILTPQFLLTPPYPPEKRRRGEEATLRLRLYIDAYGNVTRVTPIGGVDATFFRAAERHIIDKWKFSPARRDGYAISIVKTIKLDFRLTECERAGNCTESDGQVLIPEF